MEWLGEWVNGLAEWGPGALSWVDEWVRTPGFGGAAAVGAAVIAFRGAKKTRDSEDARERESRWWEQARWAADLLREDPTDQAMGIAALDQLVHEASDVEAAEFARAALGLVLFVDEDAVLDADCDDEGGTDGEEIQP